MSSGRRTRKTTKKKTAAPPPGRPMKLDEQLKRMVPRSRRSLSGWLPSNCTAMRCCASSRRSLMPTMAHRKFWPSP